VTNLVINVFPNTPLAHHVGLPLLQHCLYAYQLNLDCRLVGIFFLLTHIR